jgi:hypothetical protein
MSKKPFIFFCDDKLKWTGQFKDRHGGRLEQDEVDELRRLMGNSFIPDRSEKEFDIETINYCTDFAPELKRLLKTGRKPDIILIDLYHPRTNDEAIIGAGNAAIKQLETAITEAKRHILNAWDPNGYEMLKDARKLCPDTPIAIYTEQGLTIANNEELQIVSQQKGEWMIKGQGKFYETCRLRSMLASKHYAKTTQNTLWIFSAILFVAALAYSYVVEQSIISVLSFGATLTSLLLAVMPYIIASIERRTRKT